MIFTVTFSLVILSSNSNIALLLWHPIAYAAQQANNNYLFITHGIASGDVTNQSVIIWSRANREAQLHVEYDTDPNFSHPDSANTALANQTTDYTAHAKLEGLSPDTLYYYRVWFSSDTSSPQSKNASSVVSDNMTGSFRTAINPSASGNKDIKFIFAGDLGGQMHCRQIDKGGYSIFSEMQELSPDFFIANGDMIYAGDKCPTEGPDGWRNIQGNFSGISDPDVNWTDISQVRDVYLKHWQYNREDPYLQRFLQNTSMYSQWDDHEVINDFGASWQHWNSFNTDREGYPNIVKSGREAFFNYSPIDRNADDPNRIYRSFNWGPDLDLLILDARSYRSPNSMADKPENNKTMLGSEQLQWLKQKLLTSSATWKVLSSDVPISVPTGSNASILGRDGWASGGNETTTTTINSFSKTGFESELQGLLEYLDYNNIKNIVFVTADVHFPANIRYEIDANGDGDKLIFHELISGPLSAFRFGLSGGVPIPKLDTTFNPKLLYEEGGI
ncbi:MAG: alkaline phosphatase D family protein, partial [Thermoproteota archaeon]|nr:alkaline phosphatase D family protein [Thermoproteota archaeon]